MVVPVSAGALGHFPFSGCLPCAGPGLVSFHRPLLNPHNSLKETRRSEAHGGGMFVPDHVGRQQ